MKIEYFANITLKSLKIDKNWIGGIMNSEVIMKEEKEKSQLARWWQKLGRWQSLVVAIVLSVFFITLSLSGGDIQLAAAVAMFATVVVVVVVADVAAVAAVAAAVVAAGAVAAAVVVDLFVAAVVVATLHIAAAFVDQYQLKKRYICISFVVEFLLIAIPIWLLS